MEATKYLAQVNIALMKDTMDSKLMHGFVSALDEVNALADVAEGFIWRLKGDNDNALAMRVFEDDFLVINMSVWRDVDSLKTFVYSDRHLEVYRQKKKWFHKMKSHHMALWYILPDHIPHPDEAKQKLEYLNINGESPLAFTFKSQY